MKLRRISAKMLPYKAHHHICVAFKFEFAGMSPASSVDMHCEDYGSTPASRLRPSSSVCIVSTVPRSTGGRSSIVMEKSATFCENRPIWRKFDLFWSPSCDLKFDLIKKWSKHFCRTFRGLPNAVYRLSLSLLVFEFSGGGGGYRPPAVRRWLRPPTVRGLSLQHYYELYFVSESREKWTDFLIWNFALWMHCIKIIAIIF